MIPLIASAIIALVTFLFHFRRRISALQRDLRAKSEEVAQVKKDFVSYVSHELKAPLASIQETTQLLLERIPGELTDKQRRLLELNLHSSKRLAGMIGKLLDLSRLQAGVVHYDMRDHEIGALVSDVVDEFRETARQKDITLTASIPSEPLMAAVDSTRFAQLLSGILENAVHFSNCGGAVQVSMCAIGEPPKEIPAPLRRGLTGRPRHGFALISVCDSGPGIEDADKRTIFQAFERLPRGRKHGQHLGLGLAIARALAEAHHGAIWVEDNPGGGSIFRVLLPLADAQFQRLVKAG